MAIVLKFGRWGGVRATAVRWDTEWNVEQNAVLAEIRSGLDYHVMLI